MFYDYCIVDFAEQMRKSGQTLISGPSMTISVSLSGKGETSVIAQDMHAVQKTCPSLLIAEGSSLG